MTLQVPLDKVHLFDAETGLSLRRSVQEAVVATGAAPVTAPVPRPPQRRRAAPSAWASSPDRGTRST